ncbi:MAG: type III-A CRISPR-associated protein Cas10/Csm1 [Endomicrobia bacterium]|nr:type III-A CRISPR-associated protein Cas10/Csm1 [Endomicrobiia bacterium]MCL2506290.1 type III-A CRISPR-associated protein Cas10/Csm1 [Endomicrobiia bacterium]
MATDKDVLIIALAGFLHDIGKFAQRAAASGYENIKLPADFDKSKYQPSGRDGNYSHIHASYSAYFIEQLLKSVDIGADKNAFVNLSARHHIPGNDWQEKIITVADRLSSGMDRQSFDDAAERIEYKDWDKTRLISIFDEIKGDIKEYGDRRCQYSLSPLSAESLFPKSKDEFSGSYKELFEKFWKNLGSLAHKDDLELWFENFAALNKVYCSCIPSASVDKTIPDISLYDHARTTSAFASALYIYHKNDEKENKAAIADNDGAEKFIFLKTKFNGIQNFIFSQGGQTNKKAAAILRGRSFYVSLLSELAGDLLLENCGLPHTSIIMNAAGSITAILPNTEDIKKKIDDTEKQINKWLIEEFYGEVSVGFAYMPFSGNDLTKRDEKTKKAAGLEKIGRLIAAKLDEKKFNKFNIDNLGVIENYKAETVCVYCGKRPVVKTKEIQCPVCADLADIGRDLVKNTKLVIKKAVQNSGLSCPIFGIYDLRFSNEENFYEDRKDGVKYWDLDISSENLEKIKTSFREFSAYVPLKNNGDIKPFDSADGDDIVHSSQGVRALGVLKADIDRLGQLFMEGIAKPDTSLSKQATFSRQLNAFFTIWLPNELKEKFPDIYTVFAGGDDLFLIGPWDKIIGLSFHLREKFKYYSCGNAAFSAGIAVLKPGEPVSTFYRLSEDSLKKSKYPRNALTLFEETMSWNNAEIYKETYEKLKDLRENNKINSAGFVKLMQFIDMAKASEKAENYKEMQNFKWRALLVYFISRNTAVKQQDDAGRQELINYFTEAISDKTKRSVLKIALWKIIYEKRARG